MVDSWVTAIIGENYAEDATLSGGSYSSPLTNLQDRDQDIVARTSDATNASTQFDVDLLSQQTIGGIALCNGNWSLDSTRRIQISNTADFSVILDDTGWGQFPGFVVDPSTLSADDPDVGDGVLRNTLLAEFPLNLIYILSTPVSARYVRFLFDDTSNTDTFLQFGYLMIGRVFRPTINYGETNGFSVQPQSDVVESLGLKRTYFEYGIKRTWQAAFPNLSTDETFRALTRMVVKSRDSRPVFVVPDPSDLLHLQNRSFLATFKQAPAIQQLLVDRTTTAFEFREL